MVPRSRSLQDAVRSVASPEPEIEAPPSAAPEPAILADAPARGRLVWPLAVGLVAALAGVVVLAPTGEASAQPVLLVLLVAGVVALDVLRIDVFARINFSPASVPALALAFVFGPVGPLAAELAVAVVRVLRRVSAVKWVYDVGALGLAGAAAAGVWSALDPQGFAGEMGAGVAAALAAYVVTSVALSTVMWLARGESPYRAWREQLAWMWPQYVGFGLLAAALVECERRLGAAGLLVFAVPVALLWVGEQQYISRSRAGVEALRARNAELAEANRRTREAYLTAITTLGHALQASYPEAGGRTERVSLLTRVLGAAMAMPERDQDALAVGVVVHDIGRVCLRPREDPALVPEISERILEPLDLPPVVRQMARHHLEHFDGTGGPDGLRASQIPLAARIVAVADTLDDLTTTLPLGDALAVLRSQAGSRLCPGVVTALERALARDPSLRRYFGEHLAGLSPAA